MLPSLNQAEICNWRQRNRQLKWQALGVASGSRASVVGMVGTHGRSNALELEMRRIRGILDRHAYAKELGVASDNSLLIKKTYADLEDVVRRFRELDQEFWGSLTPSLTGWAKIRTINDEAGKGPCKRACAQVSLLGGIWWWIGFWGYR